MTTEKRAYCARGVLISATANFVRRAISVRMRRHRSGTADRHLRASGKESMRHERLVWRITPVLCLLLVTADLNAQRPIRVYVAPVETVGGFTDYETKRRADSRLDLIKNLSDDKTLAIVESSDRADVTLELLSSAQAETGEVRTETTRKPAIIGGGEWSDSKKDTAPTVLVKLTAGEYTREVKGQYQGIRWRDAANNAGGQIKHWIKENRAQLLAKHPQ